MAALMAALESYRGRDRALRALCYVSRLAGGALAPRGSAQGLSRGLLAVSAQLSSCRTVLRLLDDFAMLRHSCAYGLGPKDEDALVRGLSVLCNVADQLYYPCEHVAWAADAGVVVVGSQRWWAASTALWGLSLLLGILRSLRILYCLRRKLRQQKCPALAHGPTRPTLKPLQGQEPVTRIVFVSSSTPSAQSHQKMRAQVKAEVLTIVSNVADLSNAVHWLPPGVLWAGRFPPWLVGLLGTISSLIAIYQASGRGSSGAA
ncbi:UNVERIFIED_CONTAM: hypothetical protein H355_012040 [Colinus virginianus]|nr:hypothetical protein H355_012040 [Colinus virginianus]